MRLKTHFCKIKQSLFCWGRDARCPVRTTSRRMVHGYCDAKRRVIEIVVLHADPDQRDGLLIHDDLPRPDSQNVLILSDHHRKQHRQ